MPLLKDAREAVDRLVEGGVSEQQTNAIVDLFVDADEQVATRSDVQQLGTRIDHLSDRIDEVEEQIDEVVKRFDQRINDVEERLNQQMEVQQERLTRRIQQTETRLLRWMMGAFAALAGLLTVFEFVL